MMSKQAQREAAVSAPWPVVRPREEKGERGGFESRPRSRPSSCSREPENLTKVQRLPCCHGNREPGLHCRSCWSVWDKSLSRSLPRIWPLITQKAGEDVLEICDDCFLFIVFFFLFIKKYIYVFIFIPPVIMLRVTVTHFHIWGVWNAVNLSLSLWTVSTLLI